MKIEKKMAFKNSCFWCHDVGLRSRGARANCTRGTNLGHSLNSITQIVTWKNSFYTSVWEKTSIYRNIGWFILKSSVVVWILYISSIGNVRVLWEETLVKLMKNLESAVAAQRGGRRPRNVEKNQPLITIIITKLPLLMDGCIFSVLYTTRW